VVEKWAPRTQSARDSPTCVTVCSGHHVMQGWGAEVGLYKLNAVDPWLERRLVSTIETIN
jgi:hypothetical protein